MNPLDQFILLCRAEPSASCRIMDFVAAFRANIGPAEARRWPRGRVAAALAQRFPVGIKGRALTGGGLALPVAGWQNRDGALVPTHK